MTPVVLSPGVMVPVILSPLVMVPFVRQLVTFSKEIQAQLIQILSPQVMTPIILSPFALSPFASFKFQSKINSKNLDSIAVRSNPAYS